MNKGNVNKRYWELDALRGVAITLMVLFHIFFVINYFGGVKYDLRLPYYRFFALSAQILFFSLVGISLYISYNRREENKFFKKYVLRGLKIILYGLLISLLSFFVAQNAIVLFGVLQFIGISIIIGYFFLNLGKINLLLGIGLILLNNVVNRIHTDNYWLLVLGIKPSNFATLDYFPLIPWFGLVLIGIYLGGIFYKNSIRQFTVCDYSSLMPIKILSYLGRHSLFIYIIHFPIIFLLVYLFSK